jgi:hypothetical protein
VADLSAALRPRNTETEGVLGVLELVTVAWMSLTGIQPLAFPASAADAAPLLVDTLQLRRIEAELELRPLEIAFPRVDANELKPFDEAVAVAPRGFAHDGLKTPTFERSVQ